MLNHCSGIEKGADAWHNRVERRFKRVKNLMVPPPPNEPDGDDEERAELGRLGRPPFECILNRIK